RHVSALDPLADGSHYRRHRPWDIEGRVLEHCAARPRGLPLRDARARRTAIGAHHHAARRVLRGRHARPPHEGSALPRDREVCRRLLLRLDALGARRARGLHLHPLGARAVESAKRPAEAVVQSRAIPAPALPWAGQQEDRRASSIRYGVNRWRVQAVQPIPMDTPVGAIRYAIRQFRLSPIFTASAVLTLALGIGGTTAIFTLIHEVMLRSLPVADPEQLYRVGDGDNCCVQGGPQDRWGMFSYPL